MAKNRKSSLIYIGAGTSGRIGVQDAVELYPTFSWPKNRIKFIIAGGKRGVTNSIEDSEDDVSKARGEIKKIQNIKNDVVIGISASGNTPFTVQALSIAKKKGALTIGISNNLNSPLLKTSELKIFLNTGREVVAGSTRLKAGTSQKVCLNLLSTLLMVKLKKVKDGRMINLKPLNKKLRERMKNIKKYLIK